VAGYHLLVAKHVPVALPVSVPVGFDVHTPALILVVLRCNCAWFICSNMPLLAVENKPDVPPIAAGMVTIACAWGHHPSRGLLRGWGA